MDHALTTIDILRSKMVSIYSAQRRVYKCRQNNVFVFFCGAIVFASVACRCVFWMQVNKNIRIEAEVQRRLELDQQLRYATSWDK